MYKFIFVDDEDFMRELFIDMLDYSSYQFTLEDTFSSAEEALTYLHAHSDISLVITDIKMGQMSGMDFCEEIRKTNSHIQLVIISGYQEFSLARSAIKQNVFDYLPKPTSYHDLDTLFTTLKAHLDELTKPDGVEDEDPHYTPLIDTIKQYINDNYAKDITLADVANHVSLNATYLSRYFKQHTQSKFIDYLSQVRIQKAKSLLQDNTVKVYEVCDLVGYKNIQHFYRVFKLFTGFTPSEYRKHITDSR